MPATRLSRVLSFGSLGVGNRLVDIIGHPPPLLGGESKVRWGRIKSWEEGRVYHGKIITWKRGKEKQYHLAYNIKAVGKWGRGEGDGNLVTENQSVKYMEVGKKRKSSYRELYTPLFLPLKSALIQSFCIIWMYPLRWDIIFRISSAQIAH